MMRAAFSRLFFVALLAGGAVASAQETLGQLLDTFNKDVEKRPEAYLERAERAWFAAERITSTGAVKSADGRAGGGGWDIEMQRLRAFFFHQFAIEAEKIREGLSVGTTKVSEEDLRFQFARQSAEYVKVEQKIRTVPDSIAKGPGRNHFLGEIALMRKDTAEALRIFRSGWQQFNLQDDFLYMVELQLHRGKNPDTLLEEGFRRHPQSPGIFALAYAIYMKRGDSLHVAKALALADRARGELWPGSVDWNTRYARALIASGRSEEVEPILAHALILLDEGPRVRQDSPEVARMRREIFALMKVSMQ